MLAVDCLLSVGWSLLNVSRLEDLQRFGASVPLAVAIAVVALVASLPLVS